MVYKIISTKLNDEDHEKFLEFCNKKGCSTSEFIRNSIITMMESESKKDVNEMTSEELRKALGM